MDTVLIRGLYSLLIVLCISAACIVSSSSAAEYVSLEMHPQHVGVFTTDGRQQFVAYGVSANGSKTNITKQVSWKSSNSNLVSIDDNGLATIHSGIISGQVVISCSYPKVGTALSPVVGSLLRPSYPVTATVHGTDGTISPEGEIQVKRGNILAIKLSPNSGYGIDSGSTNTNCSGLAISGYHDSLISVGPITAECSIEVHFSPLPNFTVSSSSSGDGTITPQGDTTVQKYQTQTYTVDPDNGFSVLPVSGTCPQGKLTPSTGDTYSYTTGEITSNCTVIANFADSITVNSSVSGGNGSVSPEGDNEFAIGSTSSFTLSPSAGYIATVLSDTCPAGIGFTDETNTTYTTGQLTADCAVTFSFNSKSYTLSAYSSGDGGIHTGNLADLESNDIYCWSDPTDNPDGCTHQYSHGTTVILNAQPNPFSSATFTRWESCPQVNGQVCTVIMTGDTSVSAVFSD